MFSAEYPDRLWGPCSVLLSGYRGCFYGVKRPGHEVAHSPPSSVKIENDGYTCNTRICLHGLDGENFTFYNFFFPLPIIMSEEGGIYAAEEPEAKTERKVMPLEKVELLDKSHGQ